MFDDVRQFSELFTSEWPGVTIGDKPRFTGNKGNKWNYGASDRNDFAGGNLEVAPAQHSGGVGMFGDFAVDAPNDVIVCKGEFGKNKPCLG
mmetsp:Transcript_23259/g.47455  ORF Transcript_23259/g.47455 Transcript_23259/m.47455 type:complete len:91 (-) Transcript_23259:93-365(-)